MSDPRYAADENSAFGDSSYVDALVVAATVMGALIGLVILKFFVDFLIDLLILRDGNESPVQRIMGRLFRKICPCWHRRTQPDEDRQETDNNNEDVEAGRFFRSRPEIERKAIIATILPTKVCTMEVLSRLSTVF